MLLQEFIERNDECSLIKTGEYSAMLGVIAYRRDSEVKRLSMRICVSDKEMVDLTKADPQSKQDLQWCRSCFAYQVCQRRQNKRYAKKTDIPKLVFSLYLQRFSVGMSLLLFLSLRVLLIFLLCFA
jgi:hypothetical protein